MSAGEEGELRRVYVIEIDPKWISVVRPNFDPRVTTFYVGETRKDVGRRFKEHRRGYRPANNPGNAAARIFRAIHKARLAAGLHGALVKDEDAWIRWDLMEALDPVYGKRDARELELATALDLRSRGYQVEGPKSLG